MGHYRAEMTEDHSKTVKWFLDGKEVSKNIFNDKSAFFSHQITIMENHYTTKDPKYPSTFYGKLLNSILYKSNG